MRWAGHVARTGEDRVVHRVLVGKPEGKRPLGRPRRRWGDNIKMDLQEVGRGRGDWMELAQDRDRWRALVGTVRDCIYLMLYVPVFDYLTTLTQQHKPNFFAATRPKDDLYPTLHKQALISNVRVSHLLNC